MNLPLNDVLVKKMVETVIPTIIVEKTDPLTMRKKSTTDEQVNSRLIVYTAVNVWVNKFNRINFFKEWLCWHCCRKGLKKKAVEIIFEVENKRNPSSPTNEKIKISVKTINDIIDRSNFERQRRKSVMEMTIADACDPVYKL